MARVLIVSSGGGHASQARLLLPAFAAHKTRHVVAGSQGCELLDCNARQPVRALLCLFQAVNLVARLRPDHVVSTGALPGLIAVLVARLFGAQTIWVDSIANAQRMSLSGRAARHLAHCTFSQWPEVAAAHGARYAGAVL